MKTLLVIVFLTPGFLCMARPLPAVQISTDSIQKIKIKKNGVVKKEDRDYRTLLIECDEYSPGRLTRIKLGGPFTYNTFGTGKIAPFILISVGFVNQFHNDRIGAELGFRYLLNNNIGFIASPVLTYLYDGSIKTSIRGTLLLNIPDLFTLRNSLFTLSLGIESGLWHKDVKAYNNIITSFIIPLWIPVKKVSKPASIDK